MFGKKKKEDGEVEDSPQVEEEREQSHASASDEASLVHLSAEVEKLKAQFKTFYEMQKMSSERFATMNEQIGGLRAMMLDRDKESKLFEAKATQAIDMVESVQPDKLMMEIKKSENKVDMLKSEMQTNEIIINNTIAELKEMRLKINSFKGLDEALKLSEEVKKSWIENKKIDANITKHSSKVEMIYSDMWKEFGKFEKLSSVVGDADKSLKQLSTELDALKVKAAGFATRKDLQDIMVKFETLEKYLQNVVFTLNKRIETFEREFGDTIDKNLDKSTKLLKGFETLATKTPDLDKYFKLLEEQAKKQSPDVKVEKIKTPGEVENVKPEKREGVLDKLKQRFKKEEE